MLGSSDMSPQSSSKSQYQVASMHFLLAHVNWLELHVVPAKPHDTDHTVAALKVYYVKLIVWSFAISK